MKKTFRLSLAGNMERTKETFTIGVVFCFLQETRKFTHFLNHLVCSADQIQNNAQRWNLPVFHSVDLSRRI